MDNRILKTLKNPPAEVVFWFTALALMLVYSFPYLLQMDLRGIHIWRQTDVLAFVRNYYENGLDFFDTRALHFMFKDYSSAQTTGEFPGLYYFVAVLWKIFGPHEVIYRICSLLIFLFGMRSAYRIAMEFTQSKFWSAFILALAFTSPAVVYYVPGFLPDTSAVAFSLIGCEFFLRYYKKKKISGLYFSILFFTLAGLMKPTALIPFIILPALFLYERIPLLRKNGIRFFPHTRHAIAGFALLFLVNLAWLRWVDYYNETYGGWFTPNTIFPFWKWEHEQLMNTMKWFRDFLIHQAYSKSMLFLLFGLLAAIIVWHRRLPRLLVLITLLITLGCAAHFSLFFKWDVHDYYLIVLWCWPLTLLTAAAAAGMRLLPGLMNGKKMKILALIFLAYNVIYCKENIQLRSNPEYTAFYYTSGSSFEVEHMKYIHWADYQILPSFRGADAWLSEKGVGRDVPIISLPDPTFGVTLYYAHRTGWTDIYRDIYTDEGMRTRIRNGADYLLVNNLDAAFERGLNEKWLNYPAGEYNSLKLYDLRPYRYVLLPPGKNGGL
jgi:hypothetical protein